ncbi:SAM-dependent methyltransferase [Mycobacterium sp. Soil538]|nr:SAM-dependent methyltransferase [Mycobacterium sp. Soil538]
MSDDDRDRWDRRYRGLPPASPDDVCLPTVFRPFAHLFPTTGTAMEVACGRGTAAVWLARRGVTVRGYDISPVAIAEARALAQRCGCAGALFAVADLDGGLPPGDPVDVLLCTNFRDRRLDEPMQHRVREGGLLAVSALSEVGAAPSRYRAAPGELQRAFGALDVVACGEADGRAWLLARR